jgi:ATP-dependent helicase/nuclease subunit A
MTTGVLVDELARSRIVGELGANLCVEAAAGTGKTTVLVRRVASLLAAGVVTVDEVVVITFTEKAAAELSTRVRDELERRAIELLRDSEPARRYFRGRFRTVLIDEFQDTDPAQAELALLLTSDQDPGEDWGELNPGPARLTVVGDPKQSIYRFRRADIAVYDRVKTGALAGSTEQIVTNFRSNEQLLRALNPAFDAIFTAELGVEPANVELQPPSQAPTVRRPPVLIAEGAVVDDAGGVRREEARVIAGLLYTAHEQKWNVRDRRENDAWRPCRWGDMAILMPARTGIEHYERALAAAGIPYRHERATSFSATRSAT